MIMIDFAIDPEIQQLWPDTCVGCLTWECRATADAPGLWSYMEKDILPGLKKRLEETPLAEMPNLAQSRKAYKAFGKDPGRLRVSSEALYRRIRQGKELYRVNNVVDINNLVSVRTGFSVGSYDQARLSGPIALRLGKTGETYAGIGKDAVDLYRLSLLADANGPFGSPSSDSTRTMITDACTSILTVIYGFSGDTAIREAIALADVNIRRFSGATATTAFMVP